MHGYYEFHPFEVPLVVFAQESPDGFDGACRDAFGVNHLHGPGENREVYFPTLKEEQAKISLYASALLKSTVSRDFRVRFGVGVDRE